MTCCTTMLLAVGPLPLIPLALTAIISFALGLLIKNAIVAKHKKRVLKVENEMLSNHSRILSLEKRISELEAENKDLRDRLGNVKPELKVS